MFDPKKEVPDLELCKKLKELGYPQLTGGWYWCIRDKYEQLEFCNIFSYDEWLNILPPRKDQVEFWQAKMYFRGYDNFIKAPTVRELGELIPHKLGDEYYLEIAHPFKSWIYWYTKCSAISKSILENSCVEDESEANARAKILIWLLENNYVTFNKKED